MRVKIKEKRIECITWILYLTLFWVISVFHEPWFDEAQAWQIARCASIKDILFTIPHYEGHPPLWHLILLPFAKSGMPYEFSLSLVSCLFSGAAMYLLIFKSPFPKAIRVLLPFTYFCFYQYGVISRPYCVMMLAFMLMAMAYKKKNECPGRYVLSILLLCFSSAYGIVIGGGIAIAWIWELWDGKNIGVFLKGFLKSKIFYWLLFLLAMAIMLIFEIMPRPDTYAMTTTDSENSIFFRIFYMLLEVPAEVTMYQSTEQYGFLREQIFFNMNLVLGCIFSIAILLILWFLGNADKNKKVFFVPYILYSVFCAAVYVCLHHYGVLLLFVLFYLWIVCYNKNKIYENLLEIHNKICKNTKEMKMIQNIEKLIVYFVIIVSIYWSISASILEIREQYNEGQSMAKFIKEYQLEKYNILCPWKEIESENGDIDIDTNSFSYAPNIIPYFKNNIFYNFNLGKNELKYMVHKKATEEENDRNLEKWRTYGAPDVIIGGCDFDTLNLQESYSMDDYVAVYKINSGFVWKDNYWGSNKYIYVKKELAQELEMEEVEIEIEFQVKRTH